MKIAFITDIHIEKDGILILNLDTRLHFKRILDQVKISNYDLIILGGDLCNTEGEADIYQWICDQLQEIDIPVLAISGNHDDSVMLAKYFKVEPHLKDNYLYFTHTIAPFEAIFLDSSTGKLGAEQWSFLENQCAGAAQEILIFMHHPPLVCDVIAMEPKYQFKEIEKFKGLIRKYPDKNFNVFTGHFHTERTIAYKNASIHITPSTYVQIDPSQPSFTPVFGKIGYREIIIKPTGEIISYVKYL